jgi:hypothetical protein
LTKIPAEAQIFEDDCVENLDGIDKEGLPQPRSNLLERWKLRKRQICLNMRITEWDGP